MANPQKNKLPISRVRTIMKSSPDVENISVESVHLVARAAELFIKYLAQESHARNNDKSQLQYKDIAAVVNQDSELEFLRELIPLKITIKEYKEIMKNKKEHWVLPPSPTHENESGGPSTSGTQKRKGKGEPSTSGTQKRKGEGEPSTSGTQKRKGEGEPSTSGTQKRKGEGDSSNGGNQKRKGQGDSSNGGNQKRKGEGEPSTSGAQKRKGEEPNTSGAQKRKGEEPSTSGAQKRKGEEEEPSTSGTQMRKGKGRSRKRGQRRRGKGKSSTIVSEMNLEEGEAGQAEEAKQGVEAGPAEELEQGEAEPAEELEQGEAEPAEELEQGEAGPAEELEQGEAGPAEELEQEEAGSAEELGEEEEPGAPRELECEGDDDDVVTSQESELENDDVKEAKPPVQESSGSESFEAESVEAILSDFGDVIGPEDIEEYEYRKYEQHQYYKLYRKPETPEGAEEIGPLESERFGRVEAGPSVPTKERSSDERGERRGVDRLEELREIVEAAAQFDFEEPEDEEYEAIISD